MATEIKHTGPVRLRRTIMLHSGTKFYDAFCLDVDYKSPALVVRRWGGRVNLEAGGQWQTEGFFNSGVAISDYSKVINQKSRRGYYISKTEERNGEEAFALMVQLGLITAGRDNAISEFFRQVEIRDLPKQSSAAEDKKQVEEERVLKPRSPLFGSW
ncbi:MAG: WGR domain-containing protein [Methylobacter sp.]